MSTPTSEYSGMSEPSFKLTTPTYKTKPRNESYSFHPILGFGDSKYVTSHTELGPRTITIPKPDPQTHPVMGDFYKYFCSDTLDIKQVDVLKIAHAFANGLTWVPMDGDYWSPSKENLQKAINTCPPHLYVVNRFDCNHFAMEMKSHLARCGITSIGMTIDYDSEHSYNLGIVVGENNVLTPVVIEPQQDKIFLHLGVKPYTGGRGYQIW